ncbi:MAG: hypothetical protein ABIH66_11825 [bacterium]
MRFRKERLFDFPCGEFLKLFMENEEPAYAMEELENVTMWKVVKEQDDGVKRIGTKEWCAHAQIPKPLQHIIIPKMLTWYEHSEWDRKTNVYSFRIEPFYLKNKLVCYGKTSYKEKGKDQTLRTFEVALKVKIPILGQIAENAMIGHLGRNEEQDYKLCRKAIEKVKGK